VNATADAELRQDDQLQIILGDAPHAPIDGLCLDGPSFDGPSRVTSSAHRRERPVRTPRTCRYCSHSRAHHHVVYLSRLTRTMRACVRSSRHGSHQPRSPDRYLRPRRRSMPSRPHTRSQSGPTTRLPRYSGSRRGARPQSCTSPRSRRSGRTSASRPRRCPVRPGTGGQHHPCRWRVRGQSRAHAGAQAGAPVRLWRARGVLIEPVYR
jgi:hypothetical protein